MRKNILTIVLGLLLLLGANSAKAEHILTVSRSGVNIVGTHAPLWYERLYTVPDWYFNFFKWDRYSHHVAGKNKKEIPVLAIGDSWFDYPRDWGVFSVMLDPSNIIEQLHSLGKSNKYADKKLYILNLSNYGEVLSNEAAYNPASKYPLLNDNSTQQVLDAQQAIQTDFKIGNVVEQVLKLASKRKHPFKYVLISGGGNDILSKERLEDLLDYGKCGIHHDYENCLNQKKLNDYMDRIFNQYSNMIKLITDNSSESKIILHDYAFITPQPKGASLAWGLINVGKGGWMYPVYEKYGIPDLQKIAITCKILEKFKATLQKLEVPNKVCLVDTQAIQITPDKQLNEIHLTPKGYKEAAEMIYSKINDLEKKSNQEELINNKHISKKK